MLVQANNEPTPGPRMSGVKRLTGERQSPKVIKTTKIETGLYTIP